VASPLQPGNEAREEDKVKIPAPVELKPWRGEDCATIGLAKSKAANCANTYGITLQGPTSLTGMSI